MKYRGLIPASLLAIFMSACSAPGTLRFYQGPPKSPEQLAIVIVPAAITIRSIDGKSVDSPSKETGTYQVELPPGHHLIAFRYEYFWGSNESGRMVKSDQTGVDAVFNAGSTYTLTYKEPQSMDEAYDLTRHFSVTLVDNQTGQSYASYNIDNLDSILAAKGMLSGQTQATQTVKSTPTEAANMSDQADKAVSQDPVKRLKFWWLMSNDKQRKEFIDWMKGAKESFAPAPDKSQKNYPPDTINGVELKP